MKYFIFLAKQQYLFCCLPHYLPYLFFNLDRRRSIMTGKVCVVGAGAVGLCTAWQVTEQMKNVSVIVYADKFTNETTSYGAAGIFQPQLHMTKSSIGDLYGELCRDSWRFFDSVLRSGQGRNAGISMIDGYQFYEEEMPEENEYYKDFVYHFGEISPKSCTFLPDTSKIVQAFRYTTLMIESRRFLPFMMQKLRQRGVLFQRRHINHISDLKSENFDVIFNCAALGNLTLTLDQEMYPARGQVMRVKAPWVKQFICYGDWVYIIPGQDYCVLGGTFQEGDSNLTVDQNDSKWILDECKKLMPSLAQAEIDHEWVGLRPMRKSSLRIEAGELLVNPVDSHRCRIIHNYG